MRTSPPPPISPHICLDPCFDPRAQCTLRKPLVHGALQCTGISAFRCAFIGAQDKLSIAETRAFPDVAITCYTKNFPMRTSGSVPARPVFGCLPFLGLHVRRPVTPAAWEAPLPPALHSLSLPPPSPLLPLLPSCLPPPPSPILPFELEGGSLGSHTNGPPFAFWILLDPPPWPTSLDPHLFGVAWPSRPPPSSPPSFSRSPLPLHPFCLKVSFLGSHTDSPISAVLMIKPNTLHLILLHAAQVQNDTRFWRLVSISPPPRQSSAPSAPAAVAGAWKVCKLRETTVHSPVSLGLRASYGATTRPNP